MVAFSAIRREGAVKFLDELKRRNVFRVAGVYGVVGWLLAQAAGVLENALTIPSWFDTVVVSLLLLGFPIALVLAWAFEVTPEGVKRTEPAAAGESAAPRAGRRFDYAILAGLVLVVAVVVADRLMPARPPAGAAVAAGAEESAPPAKSIAVLPFVDLSPEKDQEYFADGLSEELLNVLAQTNDLKVAGRTSSFAFKGQNRDLRDIGEALGVAHILEGSVRKAGNRIRVTAQLIKASDGFHLFSESYDGDLNDIFAVQDDIAGKIALALKTELMGEAPAAASAPSDFKAYDLYLLARQRIATREPAQMKEARKLLDRALAIDPGYAPAYAQKAVVTILLSDSASSYGSVPFAEAAPEAQTYIDKALAIDPNLAEAHAALGLLRMEGGASIGEIETPLRRALEINPNLMDAQNWLANAYFFSGRPAEAQAIYESVIERDPLYRPAFSNLIRTYVEARDFAKAEAIVAKAEQILGGANGATLSARGEIALAKGELAEAVTRLRAAAASNWSGDIHEYYYTLALTEIGDLEAALDVASAPHRKALILSLMGREEAALAAIEAMPEPPYADAEIVRGAVHVLVSAERFDEAAEYVARHFGGAAEAAAVEPINALEWAGALARAYRKLGRATEFAVATALLDEALRLYRAGNADTADYWRWMAELAVLRGDSDLALQHLKTSIAKGGVSAYGFSSPVFDDLGRDRRFNLLEADMRERANAERAKLGMAPV